MASFKRSSGFVIPNEQPGKSKSVKKDSGLFSPQPPKEILAHCCLSGANGGYIYMPTGFGFNLKLLPLLARPLYNMSHIMPIIPDMCQTFVVS